MEQTCLLCGKEKRWSQRFCGAGCSARFESGDRPETSTALVVSKGYSEYTEAILVKATREEAHVLADEEHVLPWRHVFGQAK